MAKANETPKHEANDKTGTKAPDYLKVSNWDTQKGETFGGSSDILMLEVDEAAGPLVYLGHRPFDPGTGKMVELHEAKDGQGHNWRLPIAANFLRQVEAANLKAGDTFSFKRLKDETKKKGLGAGNTMQMFVIKVHDRAK